MQGWNPPLPQLPYETLPRLPSTGLPQQGGAACSRALWIWKGHKIDFTLQITQFIILSAEAACEIRVLGPHTFTYVRHFMHKMLGVICRLHWQIPVFFHTVKYFNDLKNRLIKITSNKI